MQGPKETVDYNTIPWQAQIPSKMCWSAVPNHSLWQNLGIGFFFHSARLHMGSSCNQLYCKYPLFAEGLDMLIDPSPSSAMPWKPLWRSPSCVNHSLSSSSGTSLVPRDFPFDRCSCYILRFQPKVDTNTERDAIRPSTVPASCETRKLGMSDYGCDGLEGPQTA